MNFSNHTVFKFYPIDRNWDDYEAAITPKTKNIHKIVILSPIRMKLVPTPMFSWPRSMIKPSRGV